MLFYGFKDARAELRIMIPAGIVLPVTVPQGKIDPIKKLFTRFYGWAMKSEDERKDGKGDAEEVLDERCKARGEFPDGHVDLYVRPVKVSPWFPPVRLNRLEILEGKPAMDEVHLFSQLPEEVRKLQGAD